MAINSFDVRKTRRLAIALISAGGALLFAALNLIGAGVQAHDRAFAAGVSGALRPLATSLVFGLMALIAVELADDQRTPAEGHPHSKRNYLETAFVFIVVLGFLHLIWGAVTLLAAATVRV